MSGRKEDRSLVENATGPTQEKGAIIRLAVYKEALTYQDALTKLGHSVSLRDAYKLLNEEATVLRKGAKGR